MFAIWSLVPLPLINPACSIDTSLSIQGVGFFWIIFRIILLMWTIKDIVRLFEHCLKILWRITNQNSCIKTASQFFYNYIVGISINFRWKVNVMALVSRRAPKWVSLFLSFLEKFLASDWTQRREFRMWKFRDGLLKDPKSEDPNIQKSTLWV